MTLRFPAVTPAEAKAVYESLPRRSLTATARRFQAAGRYVARQTLIKWQRRGWQRKKDERVNLDVLVPVLTRNPMTRMTDLVPPSETTEPATGPLGVDDGERDALESMADAQLMSQSARQVHITAILLSKEIQRQRAGLVKELPTQTGSLLQAIAASVDQVNASYGKLVEASMKTISAPTAAPVATIDDPDADIRNDPLYAELKQWEKG